MISLMNNNGFELDRTADSIGDESQAKGVVSGDGCFISSENVVYGDGDRGSLMKSSASEENRVSQSGVVDSVCDGTGDDKSMNLAGSEEIRDPAKMEIRTLEAEADRSVPRGVVNVLENAGSERIRVSEVDWEGLGEEMKPGTSEIRTATQKEMVDYGNMRAKNSESEQWRSGVENDGANSEEKGIVGLAPGASEHTFEAGNVGLMVGKGHAEVVKPSVSQYDSMISMFDEFAANSKGKTKGGGMSSSVGYGYEIGDMVWGKVKSHPWWPGHIYSEAFISPSVRRTKRAGHVLVAFFGDSSYGWFDPAELIPFDANFSEKSRQTNSRTFAKAVEEAIDEASRRCGLGLACRCRNPYNFRPTNIPDYFAVDVYDYEPGGVYSTSQIRKARNSFRPTETLFFVKQLALMPMTDRYWCMDFIKNKASVLAYRRAVYEEFDETYAQAFGVQPVRPSREPSEAIPQPARAPLSGPLVIAEALGKKKNYTKSNKVKDPSNKDRYLFKRRDEPSELKPQQIGQTASFLQPAYVEGSVELGGGDYVLQKRYHAVSTKKQIPVKPEQMVTIRMDSIPVSSRDVTAEEVATMQDSSAAARFGMAVSPVNGSKAESPTNFSVNQASAYTGHQVEYKSSLDKGKGVCMEAKEPTGYNAAVDPAIVDNSGMPGRGVPCGGVNEVLASGQGRELAHSLNLQSSNLAAIAEVHVHDRHSGSGSGPHALPTHGDKFPGQVSRIQTETGTKKTKLLKRPGGELGIEKSVTGEKKKKRKKELGVEMSHNLTRKQPAIGKGGAVGRVIGKAVQVVPPFRDDFHKEQHHNRDEGASSSFFSDSLGTGSIIGMGNIELKLPQLLGDLQALALNHFHGVGRNCPGTIRQVFLKFRSLVYQKSLALSSPTEMEFGEAHTSRSPAGGSAVSDHVPRENIKDHLSLKPPKTSARPDDPTKGGRKRLPSDRQEELAAKRSKKITEMKSLAADRKAAQRSTETQRDAKETVPLRPSKPLRPDFIKKPDTPARTREPTMLVMKFPPKTTLPSGAELKARLARFGPLDHSLTRIFWKTSTCRVVFIYRVDAEAAQKHLLGNNTVFGTANVRCHIRPLVTPAPEPETKPQREDAQGSLAEQRPLAAAPAQQPLLQPVVQLKSCLKKPIIDEAGVGTGTNGGGRGTPRVKFMLEGGESSGGGQLMVGNKNNFINNASFADGGASSSSSHGLDFNSKNFQKVIPPPSSPLLPLPQPYPHQPPTTSQFPNSPNNLNLHYAQVAPRNPHNVNPNMAVQWPPPPIDVGPQMMSLLTKCNEVVTHIKNFLGFIPYHPL